MKIKEMIEKLFSPFFMPKPLSRTTLLSSLIFLKNLIAFSNSLLTYSTCLNLLFISSIFHIDTIVEKAGGIDE